MDDVTSLGLGASITILTFSESGMPGYDFGMDGGRHSGITIFEGNGFSRVKEDYDSDVSKKYSSRIYFRWFSLGFIWEKWKYESVRRSTGGSGELSVENMEEKPRTFHLYSLLSRPHTIGMSLGFLGPAFRLVVKGYRGSCPGHY